MAAGDDAALLEAVIPDVVDEVLFRVMLLLDEGVLDVELLSGEDDEVESVPPIGELAGWLVGPDGWIRRFTTERRSAYLDDVVVDLTPPDEREQP